MTTASIVFVQKLSSLKGQNQLQDYVINHVLEFYLNEKEALSFFQYLHKKGCVSGMVGSLISYANTNDFYERFETEIENLLEELMENMGYANRFETISSLNGADDVGNITQEKNLLAWFGFEETAYNLACILFPNEF